VVVHRAAFRLHFEGIASMLRRLEAVVGSK